MSSIELKKQLRNDIWRPADTALVSIGQFDNSFTAELPITSPHRKKWKTIQAALIKEVVVDGLIVNKNGTSFLNWHEDTTIAA
jgi:hypothetical protein